MHDSREAGRRGTSPVVEMLLVIGGLGLAIASAIVVVVVRALRRSQRDESTRRGDKQPDIGSRQDVMSLQRTAEEAERASWSAAARVRAEEGARISAEQQAQRRAEEERVRAEAARAAADQEARRQAEEERRRVEEEARVAAEQQAQREADEVLRRAEEETRVSAEQDAQRQAEEDHRRRVEEEARAAAGQQAQREAEEVRRRAEEETRVAAEQDARRQAEEERRRVEEEARVAAHQEGESARIEAQEDARRRGDEGRRTETARAPVAGLDVVVDTRAVLLELPDPDGIVSSTRTAPLSATLGEPAMPLRTPRQYRPTPRIPPGPRGPAPATTEREARDRAMPVEVRLVFEKAGFCRVSLLPRRASGMPIELAVTGSGDPPELLALQDEWYQDVAVPNLERLLRDGIEWAGSLPGGRSARWSLSGRELYVLARHGELNGFVSAPRLILGEEHVVLCIAERLSEVRAAIALTGSPEPALLNSDSGVPAGWAGLRGVLPRRPIAPSSDGEILDALRPLAEVNIALVGGIRIERQTWLSGFPPSIQLRGDTSTIGVVRIDERDASLTPGGGYVVVPGWDSPGEHSVWCTSDSRTYAIRSGPEDWESWDAYTWSLGEVGADGTQSRPAICGVLVRPPRSARSDSRAIVVAASNPVLIGAGPGEIEICTPRGDVRAGLCVGFPWFEPIWAIPADALHCDKRTARVLLIGPAQPVATGDRQVSTRPIGRVSHHRVLGLGAHTWCTAILTAGRKGLQTEPSRAEIADLWKTYKRYARGLWRGRR